MADIILQIGAKVLLKNKEGKFLLVHRSLEKYPEVKMGRWDIVGGRINPGSLLIENLRREIKEEVGLDLIGEPKLIAAQDIITNAERHVVRLTYFGGAKGDVILDTAENDSYQWYSRDEIARLEDIDVFLKKLIDGKYFGNEI
jgi:ADP-ribose pyrophosphatase YjhB (NUDIX family)